jgi:hypothetical protein
MVKCDNGYVNESRCPYWQSYGDSINTTMLLDSPFIMNSELCGYITELMRDFQTIQYVSWRCTEWTSICDDQVKCVLISNNGDRYSVDEVIKMYSEVITNDGERAAPEDFYH